MRKTLVGLLVLAPFMVAIGTLIYFHKVEEAVEIAGMILSALLVLVGIITMSHGIGRLILGDD